MMEILTEGEQQIKSLDELDLARSQLKKSCEFKIDLASLWDGQSYGHVHQCAVTL